jgi:hypothetical protein
MRIELRWIEDDRLLESIEVDDPGEIPHPGRWLTLGERSYLVLQRRHRYQLQGGRYELASVALLVKRQRRPDDARPWNGGWVIGDPRCRFNARSPLLRCAVLPMGPCDRCSHFTPLTP